MGTGIYHRNLLGELEEVDQGYIDFWCGQCQFPYGLEKCRDKKLIQRCWYELYAIAITLQAPSEAHVWHLQHECPFIHKGERCHCNDYKTIEEAFTAAGIEYRQSGKEER